MKPMMSDKEIKIVDDILSELKPKKCLEWGAGGSTVYFPEKHPEIESWTSIEHNGGWYQKLVKRIPFKVDLRHVKVVDYLKEVEGEKYDFILIDGLMRAECLMVAEDMLNPGGVILVHDTGRAWYQDLIKLWPANRTQKLIDGEIPMRFEGFAHRGIHKFTK